MPKPNPNSVKPIGRKPQTTNETKPQPGSQPKSQAAVKAASDPNVIKLPKTIVKEPEPEPVPGAEFAEISCNGPLEEAPVKLDRISISALSELADQIDDFDRQIEDLTERKKTAEEQAAGILDSGKIRTLAYGDYTLGYIHSSNSSLSADLMLANGVPSWLIAACRTRKQYRYFKFTNNARAAEKRAAKKLEKEQQEQAEGTGR